MNILYNQSNIFGDNHNHFNIHQGATPRKFTAEIKNKILVQLKEYNAVGVAIHFEYGDEAEQFVQQIEQFLKTRGFEVNCYPKMMSGIPRGVFSIEPSKDTSNWAYLRIGSAPMNSQAEVND
jgi:hypothetical protein